MINDISSNEKKCFISINIPINPVVDQTLCTIPPPVLFRALTPFFLLLFESTIKCACFLIRCLLGTGFSSSSLFADSTTLSSNDHKTATS